MYETFFNLSRSPFDIAPDPTCFVPTRRHNEALAALYYGIRRHRGFVVVTGEVGTGKTLLLRCLLGVLRESRDVAYAYVFNGRLTPTEFLQYVLADLGLPASGKTKSDLLIDLGHFLAARGSKKMTTVLIVDEAHHLSADILEEIRLLSNLETDDDKLLQIVLVGQPELNKKLDSIELRQLKQRIAVRSHLGSLDAVEVEQYIHQRLQIAGRDQGPDPLFTSEAIAAVFLHSGGLPRLINTICDNALVIAYARRLPSVTSEIIEDVAIEFRLDRVCPLGIEKIADSNEMNIERVRTLLSELYPSLTRSIAGDSDMGTSLAVELTEHEPHI
jgi:general secretion pathway protein A